MDQTPNQSTNPERLGHPVFGFIGRKSKAPYLRPFFQIHFEWLRDFHHVFCRLSFLLQCHLSGRCGTGRLPVIETAASEKLLQIRQRHHGRSPTMDRSRAAPQTKQRLEPTNECREKALMVPSTVMLKWKRNCCSTVVLNDNDKMGLFKIFIIILSPLL